MRRHEYESPYNPAATELSRALIHDGGIRPDMFAKITNVLEGVKHTDEMISQKDTELQSKNNLLVQKDQLLLQKEQLLIQKDKNLGTLKESGTVGEQKEFVDALHKLYPKWYPEKLEDWSSDTWGKQVIDRGDYKTIQANLPTYRKQVLEKEFIDILHELYPSWYPVNFKDWPADSWGKEVVDGKNYKAIEGNLPIYKQWLANKKELIEILPKLHPQSYPVNYEEWTNQYAKGLLDKGDYKTIEQSLPIYRKQLARKEFIEILPKLYPNDYPVGFENWTGQWGKGVVDRDEFETIKGNLAIYKKNLLKKEYIDIMHQVNPKDYPARFEDWSNKTLGKEIVEKEDYKAMEQSLSDYRQKLKENELTSKKQLLIDKHKETEDLKALIAQKELEKQEVLTKTENVLNSKDQLLVAKDNEMESLRNLLLQKEAQTQELLAHQELEKKELLAQKEAELQDKLHDKSLVKNQVIGELQEDIGLKEKEAYKLQIESLMKQVEFHKKESELKDKALEDAYEIAKQKQIVNELKEKELADVLEIVKQKDVINELQGKLLELKALYGHDISFSEQFSAIQFQAENNIANNDFNAIQDLSRYISELLDAERENSPSIDLATLLALNETPVLHVQENPVQQNVPVINNFDINNVHTTHSVLVSMSGEGSESYEIIQQESFH